MLTYPSFAPALKVRELQNSGSQNGAPISNIADFRANTGAAQNCMLWSGIGGTVAIDQGRLISSGAYFHPVELGRQAAGRSS